MPETPLVTIAIPTLNRSAYLQITLASALAQTYPALEILVSDNASEDDTLSFLRSIEDERLRVLRQPMRLPMYPHWNLLVDAARGQYFLLLSDDDILEPHAIATMVQRFQEEPEAGVVFCQGTIIDSEGRPTIPGKGTGPRLTAKEMILGFFHSELDLWPCSILFRRAEIEGGYPPDFPLGADAALWMHVVAQYGQAAFVEQSLTHYRVHRNTTTTAGFRAWQEENRRLAAFAVERLCTRGDTSPLMVRRIQSACRGLNVRIAAGLIKSSAGDNRSQVVRHLVRNLGQFASPYGSLVLLKTLVELSVPRSWRAPLVQWSRSLKQIGRAPGSATRG